MNITSHFRHIIGHLSRAMADRTCEQCGTSFAKPCQLLKHQQRKTPCSPIIDSVAGAGKTSCHFCGRSFASYTIMRRHVRQNCRIANSVDGMELLFERTLAKQEAAEMKALKAEVAALRHTVATQGPAPQTVNNAIAGDSGQIAQTGSQINNNTINIFADRPMALSPEVLLDAIKTCPYFHQFSQIHDDEKFSDENRHIIHGSIMDLTALSHETPEHRNIYLSKRDQMVMVMSAIDVNGPQWEVLPLADAVKTMVAGMSKELRNAGGNHTIKMEIDDRGALCGLGFATLAEGDALASELRPQMVAHLQSQRLRHS